MYSAVHETYSMFEMREAKVKRSKGLLKHGHKMHHTSQKGPHHVSRWSRVLSFSAIMCILTDSWRTWWACWVVHVWCWWMSRPRRWTRCHGSSSGTRFWRCSTARQGAAVCWQLITWRRPTCCVAGWPSWSTERYSEFLSVQTTQQSAFTHCGILYLLTVISLNCSNLNDS